MHYPYPIRFHPIYKDYLWGGSGLAKKYGRELPGDVIAESWEIASHPHGTSVAAEGELAGRTLPEIVSRYGRDLMGSEASNQDLQKFPLLLKFLDANDYLSVQVHPDNEYARQHENGELGKCEAWHVIAARPGAKIVYGLKKGTTRDDFKAAIARGRVEDCLHFVEVSSGDTFYISPGLVHSLGAGVMVAEIQQNSDTVYRVYDWNRVDSKGKPRELHVEKALDVIDFGLQPSKVHGVCEEIPGGTRTILVESEFFVAELLKSQSAVEQVQDGRRFALFTVLDGSGELEWGGGRLPLRAGTSYLLPASLGPFAVHGQCELLKCYVPPRR